jgi:hypothetical protein
MDMYFYLERNKKHMLREVHYKGKAIKIVAMQLYAARGTSQ